MKVGVVGAGAWGTTLSILLSEAGHEIGLWVYEEELCGYMIENRENKWYLPKAQIPVAINISSSLQEIVEDAELVLFSVPSKHLSSIALKAGEWISRDAAVLSATKGLEHGTGNRMSQVLGEIVPKNKIAVISGPNLSKEISRGLPAVTVVACEDVDTAKGIQSAIMLERFRVYTSSDVAGVELGGALKNIIAIAAGIVDELKLGDNAKAGLMVRGIAEISRLGVAMGARPGTFAGLSGIGDLITTCQSKLSRNHHVGENIAKGRCLDEILSGMREVAEGVGTTKVAVELAKKHNVEMPITQEIYRVLFEKKDPYQAISDLMTRKKKKE